MAATPGTIKVCFTTNYTGTHRVCYRLSGSSGGYTCVNKDCAGGGANCCAEITITVDNETCNTLVYEGYVQPACEDISSTANRVAFTTSFVPSPTCKRYVATCGSAGLDSVTIDDGGTAYSSAPSVSFTGGGGTGATASATIGTGFILTSSITSGGTYNVDGTYTNVDMQGSATGTGAKATVTIAGNTITILTITTPGNGYRNTDVLYPAAAAVGGATVNGQIAITTDYQKVTAITITAAGSGYTSAPTVVIAPSSGTQARATAVLGYCVAFSVTSCDGISGNPVADNWIRPGSSVNFCTAGTPPAPTNYTITQSSNCLCNCQTTKIAATGSSGSVQYRYTTCNGGLVSGTLDPTASPSSITVCAVSGSPIVKNVGAATGTITLHGAC